MEVDGIIQKDQQIMKGAESDILGFRKAKEEESLKKNCKDRHRWKEKSKKLW